MKICVIKNCIKTMAVSIVFTATQFNGHLYAQVDPYTAGTAAFGAGQYENAAKHFKAGLQKYPDNVAYTYMLAMSYTRSGKKLEAVSEFEKVIRAQPEEELLAKSYVNLLRALVDLEDLAEVERFGTQAQAALPLNGEILNQIGRSRLNQGQYPAAIDILTRATRLDSNSWTIYNNLGLAYLRSGNYTGAKLAFERAAVLKSDQPFIFNNLGVAHEKLAEYDQAIAAFQNVLKIDPAYSKAKQNIKRMQKLKARSEKLPNYTIQE